MSRYSLSIAAATLLAVAAAPVTAATEPAATPTPWEQHIEQLFVQIDRNGEGMINATEAKTNKGLDNAFRASPRPASSTASSSSPGTRSTT